MFFELIPNETFIRFPAMESDSPVFERRTEKKIRNLRIVEWSLSDVLDGTIDAQQIIFETNNSNQDELNPSLNSNQIVTTAIEISDFVRRSSDKIAIPETVKIFKKSLNLSLESRDFLNIGQDSPETIAAPVTYSTDSETSVTPESGYNTPQTIFYMEEPSEFSEMALSEAALTNRKRTKSKKNEIVGVFSFDI